MKDIITYIPDLTAFRIEAVEVYKTKGTTSEHPAAKFLSLSKDGILVFIASQTPVKYNENKSLCLVRTNSHDNLDGTLENFEIIGECINGEYEFRPYGKAKYESAYNTKPIMIDNGEGGEIEYTPPYMFGSFA